MYRLLTLEINDEGVCISDECSSGVKFSASTPEEFGKALAEYLTNYPNSLTYDRRAAEEEYDLQDGELDGVPIREAEKIVGEEEGSFDRFIIYDEDYFNYDEYDYDPDDDYYRSDECPVDNYDDYDDDYTDNDDIDCLFSND